MSEPFVSVITPAYNVSGYLSATIESLSGQSNLAWEHIIVDDGSTDGTGQIAHRAAETDSRHRVITIVHAGSAAARNAGFALARGRYIAFLDGDDTWDRDFLRVMLSHLSQAPLAVRAVFCQSWQFDQINPRLDLHAFEGGLYDKNRLLSQWNPTGNGSALLIRREAFQDAGTFSEDLPSAVDFDMWLRMLAASPDYRFLGVPDIVTHYRRRSDSVSADLGARFDALNRIIHEHASTLSARDRCSYSYPILMGFDAGRRSESVSLYLAALPLGPVQCLVDSAWRRATILFLLATVCRPIERPLRRIVQRIRDMRSGRASITATGRR